jgi:hypothetical protein
LLLFGNKTDSLVEVKHFGFWDSSSITYSLQQACLQPGVIIVLVNKQMINNYLSYGELRHGQNLPREVGELHLSNCTRPTCRGASQKLESQTS